MANKLFTSTIDKQLFNQYKFGGDLSKQKVVAKIFNPYGEGRWFLLNSDPDDPDYLWAIVSMHGNVEIGSVSRNELMNLRLTKYGLPLERDLYFTPKNAKEIYDGLLEGEHFAKGGVLGLSVSGYTIKGRKGNYYIHDVQGRLVEKTYETLDEVKKAFDRLVVMRAHQKHESKSMSETLADVDRFYAKGGMTSGSDDLYIGQLASISGTRAVAVKEWVSSNNLSNDDVLNIIQGLGRKQIATREFINAVLGDKNATMMVTNYAKSGKGLKMAKGGAIDLSTREKSQIYTYLDESNWTLESFMEKFDKTEEEADDIILSWASSRGLKIPKYIQRMAQGGSLKDRSERDSIRLSKEYQKVLDSNFNDTIYEKYQKLVKESQIPKKELEKIENYIMTTPKGQRRYIDIYQYWDIKKMAKGGRVDSLKSKVKDYSKYAKGGELGSTLNVRVGDEFATLLPDNPKGGELVYGLLVDEYENESKRNKPNRYRVVDLKDQKKYIVNPYRGDKYLALGNGEHKLVIEIPTNGRTLLKDLIYDDLYSRGNELMFDYGIRAKEELPPDFSTSGDKTYFVVTGGLSRLYDYATSQLPSVLVSRGSKLYSEPTKYKYSIIWQTEEFKDFRQYRSSEPTTLQSTYVPLYIGEGVIDAKPTKTTKSRSSRYFADGGELAEYWEKITEETINERFSYQYLNYFDGLFSGDIWLKFSKQPTTREFNLPYEVKRAINEDFEYYSYGEGTPMEKVSLVDGSWGTFYIHVENLPYLEIIYLLTRLPNEVQERLELKGIKGYGELGFDTYGQTFNLTLTNPDTEEVESGGKGKNVILSFSFNSDNISLEDVTEIVENYTKDWRTGGDIFEPNFYVNLRESEANDLKDELESYGYFYDIEIEDSRYQYADGGELDSKKKVEFDEGGETSGQHYEPTYLMTLDEYINLGIPTTIKNYEKFIKKNQKYLARAGYSGLDYWTLEDALESSKNPFEEYSNYDWIRNIEELGGATRIDYAREKDFDNWSDEKYTQDPTPIEIRVENQVFREKLSKYFPHTIRKYKEKTWTTSGMQKIDNEFKKTNKVAIRNAMQDGVYKELLNTGKISIDRLKEITDSVGVRITKDTLSGDKKVEFMEGLKKTLSGMPQKSFDKVKEFAEDFHKELKELSDIVYEKEYKRLSDVILSFIGERVEMSRVSMSIPITLFFIYDYTSEQVEGKTKYSYDRITMVDIKALQPNWEKYLKDYVKFYVESLKWNIVRVMADVFRRVTIPIKKYEKISLDLGKNGFEGRYKFTFEDGSSFVVNTQGIGAGGYNIQVFHYRYLTNITNATLPSGEVTKDLSHWEKRFAMGGEIKKHYRHKHIPTMTLEVVDYTYSGVKGLQKDTKSLSPKERKEGKMVFYSKADLNDLFEEVYAKGGVMGYERLVSRMKK